MGGLKIVFGAAGFNPGTAFGDHKAINEVLDVLEKNGVKNLDTAQLYGQSEEVLGEVDAGKRFIIDTKSKGGFDLGNALKPDVLRKLAHESNEKLKVKPVDIFYIHARDTTIPIETWTPVVNELYKEGVFKRFGLSNFFPEDVQAIYDHCKKNGYVLPTSFQGNYSPVARRQDTELFPLLKKLGISFYAYSPLAGGFLTKTKQQLIEAKDAGRFAGDRPVTSIYRTLYCKPSYLDALAEWEQIAKDEGVSRAELAYRWVSYHSPLKAEDGDAVIFGASKLSQVEETINFLKAGPLKLESVKAIDQVWEKIKDDAPLDNYNSHVALQQQKQKAS